MKLLLKILPLLISFLFSEVKIASWNIRNISSKSRNFHELEQISQIMKQYDVIAIQEIKDFKVLKNLKIIMGTHNYIHSDKVGRGRSTEIYAFFYNNKVKVLDEGFTFPDTNDVFFREPFIAKFKSDKFDFYLATIHVVFGKKMKERYEEMEYFSEVINYINTKDPKEKDILILGDFNLSPRKSGMKNFLHENKYSAMLKGDIRTTIGDTSLYDNILMPTIETFNSEYSKQWGMEKFDLLYETRREANNAVSDHRPIFGVFKTDKDDD